MTQVTICDDAFGAAPSGRKTAGELKLDVSQIRAADLIRLRVEMEYETQEPKALVNGTDLSGYSRPPASLDAAIAEAQRGLERNAFFLIVNGRQVRTLDEIIPLDAANSATFLKLVPLKGG